MLMNNNESRLCAYTVSSDSDGAGTLSMHYHATGRWTDVEKDGGLSHWEGNLTEPPGDGRPLEWWMQPEHSSRQ